MCGIAGCIVAKGFQVSESTLESMGAAMHHRGPDGNSLWLNNDKTVGFYHNRLSIIELSDKASQPLHFLHYTIVFNGAVYNYPELKNRLMAHGYIFKSDSDTEVIPAAFDKWGIDCLNRIDGMFAFALYDSQNEQIVIARDRFGEKPFYYHVAFGLKRCYQKILFASEINALFEAGVPKNANGTMVLNYLTLGYVQNPVKKSQTFYNDIQSLPPGHALLIDLKNQKIKKQKWYTPNLNTISISENDALEKFNFLLKDSVAKRLRADVSIAASLSGGLDSSCIVALINELDSSQKNQWSNICFSAVFPGFYADENVFSKQVAEHFNIHRTTIQPHGPELYENFKKFLNHQSEPVTSASAYVQYMIYREANKNGIKVMLEGQGADEVLSGYKRYSHWYLQQLIAGKHFKKFLTEKKALKQNEFLEQWHLKNYAAAFLPEKSSMLLQKRAWRQQIKNPFIHCGFFERFSNFSSLQKPVVQELENILYYNTFIHGLEELLRFADRSAMAHSVEVRLPFLSHELVEFVFSLPSSFKIKNGFTKWILRKSFEHKLPHEVVWRKNKIGYEPPQKEWMQEKNITEMIYEARKTLVEKNVLNKNIFKAPLISANAHEAGNLDWRILNIAHFL